MNKCQINLILIKILSILEIITSNPPTQPRNDNENKNSAENIVKMSLSKSDVDGTFQFSKISIDNAKTYRHKVVDQAKSIEIESRNRSSKLEVDGEESNSEELQSNGVILSILLLSGTISILVYLTVSRLNFLSHCSYFPQDLTDKADDEEDEKADEDEFVYISSLTSV